MLLMAVCISVSNAYAQEDDLIKILNTELDREFEILSQADDPVYYMDYQVRDVKTLRVSANLGSLNSSTSSHNRMANATVRVGSYEMDNTHTTSNQYDRGYGMNVEFPVPLENNEKAIAHFLWTLTNLKYQGAQERYKKISTDAKESETADFSKETPEVFIGEIKSVDFKKDQKNIEARLKRLSGLFLENEDIVIGEVSLNRELITKYFVSTEGAKIVHQLGYNFMSVNASIRGPEGEMIPLYQTYFAFDIDELPAEDVLEADIKRIMKSLVDLQTAPLAEPYSGPAILHPRVAGVFFHEIFGHRIEGSRLKSDFDSQTFKEKVGEPVLPKSINVYMDPTINKLGDQDLIGYYVFDDEGIRGQKINVVDQGILRNFLMTRKPLKQFSSSNGHARTQGGLEPVSRQSNLIVEANKEVSNEDLRKQLIKECKKQKKKYGYYFKDVQGGFTNTDRFSPNAFNIIPTLVYRVYVDGRPDELVRGVDLIGTPLSMFAEIKTASDERATFNGFCGAESGRVPVSATAPGLLVRRIETQKQYRQKGEDDSPILPRPVKQ